MRAATPRLSLGKPHRTVNSSGLKKSTRLRTPLITMVAVLRSLNRDAPIGRTHLTAKVDVGDGNAAICRVNWF